MKSFATGLTGRIGFVVLACTLVLGLLTAVPAGATTNASISGTVTAAVGGAPLQYICVFAVSTDGGGQTNTVTAVDGTYSLINLVPDTYIVDFYVQAGCAGGNYAEQWYNATNAGTIIKANATAVPLTSGLAQTGINARWSRERQSLERSRPPLGALHFRTYASMPGEISRAPQ